MSIMRIPSTFRSLPARSLRVGRPLTADIASTLAGNSGWLYEATFGRPVPGHETIQAALTCNHLGDGSGAPIPTVQNLPRGWFGATPGFTDPVVVSGGGPESVVSMVIADHPFGGAVDGVNAGYSWRRTESVPVVIHPYARFLRTSLRARRVSGNQVCRLSPVLFSDESARSPMTLGAPVYVTASDFETYELLLDLGRLATTQGEVPFELRYWGLTAWVPPGCVLEVRDDDITGGCLALSSF